MPKSVIITTPMPTLDEIAESLGLSAARRRALDRILEGNRTPRRESDRADLRYAASEIRKAQIPATRL